jgi:hypothetical protein
MGSAARHSSGRKAAHRHKSPPVTSPTSLIDLADTLQTVGCTVDVTSSALARSDDDMSSRASMVLLEHVFEPIEKARAAIVEICRRPIHRKPIVKTRRRRTGKALKGAVR